MIIPTIAEMAKVKGIKLMGTGDFTHPEWVKELKENLKQEEDGIFKYGETYFLLTTEVSNVVVKFSKIRKIHNIIFAPSFKEVEEINSYLQRYGKLEVDGRPTLNLDAEEMVKVLTEINPGIKVSPSHIWTPWFSLFGAHFGYDSIEECFGEKTELLLALETGLSSDPPMNWRWSALDKFALISNSDAHSPVNIGREMNFFDCKIEYKEIMEAIKHQDARKFKFTIEFFPEEGKYHWDGHRRCGVRVSPWNAIAYNNVCPKCGKSLTIGVMHRVISLSDREEPTKREIGFYHLIPLMEIIAEVFKTGKNTERVLREYNKLVREFNSEIECLLEVPYEEIVRVTNEKIAEAITQVREGKVKVVPGYDGVYGEIKIESKQEKKKQLKLF
jgi:uncharacterized protein (TIGR00375 family)